MQIEVNEIEPCKLMVNYTADAGEILDKRNQVLNAFKKAPVSGFRPGHAPLDAIARKYKIQVDDALKRALAEDAYHNTLFEKKIKPHGAPRFDTMMLGNGKFTCEFQLHTKPDFELIDLTSLEIPKPHQAQTESVVVEKMLEELRRRFGTTDQFTETDFVQTGDNIIVNYEGLVDGEKVPSLCAEGEMLTVGSSPLAEFDNALLGMVPGDSRSFVIRAPKESLPSIADKDVHFSVSFVTGSKITPCPMDNTLAQKLGKSNLEELRELVRGISASRLEADNKTNLNNAISARLISSMSVDVPNWMKLSEAQYLAHNAKLEWESMSDDDKVGYITVAEKNVKLALILDKVRETEPEAQLTDNEVFDVIKQNLSKTKVDKPIDDIMKEMVRTGYIQILFSRIRDEFALDFVAKTVKVVE